VNANLRILLLTVVALSAAGASAQRLYRWVDENGNVHFGDRIPPEYADRDRTVLNSQGVAVEREEGAVTETERAALERQQAQEAAEREARAEIARRDRMLLETYLSVADIESLRDSRVEMLESQVTVTELYLSDLTERLKKLRADAGRYKPYSDREDAPELPADLARDIARTEASIGSYQQSIERTRDEQIKLKSQFDSDIERFRQLKGS
jgi:hypothetical protein